MSHSLSRLRVYALLLLCALPVQAMAQAYTLNEELMYRINFGRSDDVRILLSRGADPNARNVQGDPALSVAIDRQDNEAPNMVKALLEKGANPNLPSSTGVYPIMRAVSNGQTGLVAALLESGAQYDIKNTKGLSLIELAHHSVSPEVAEPIQHAIDEKKAYEDSLRSPERYKTVVRFYRFHNCEYQYWNYFKSSKQDPGRNKEADNKIEAHKNVLIDLVHQFQKYFPRTSPQELENISNDAAGQIFNQMDILISNRNRIEHGIGHDRDADNRCWKIAEVKLTGAAFPSQH